MTGRELMLWILENNLVDKELFKDGDVFGFISIEKAAVKLDTGVATITIMLRMLDIEKCYIGGKSYITYKDFEKLAKSKERKNDK